jgi:hypothetical protein
MVGLTIEQVAAALELASNELKEEDENVEDFDTRVVGEAKPKNPSLDNVMDCEVESTHDNSDDDVDITKLLSKKRRAWTEPEAGGLE